MANIFRSTPPCGVLSNIKDDPFCPSRNHFFTDTVLKLFTCLGYADYLPSFVSVLLDSISDWGGAIAAPVIKKNAFIGTLVLDNHGIKI